MLRLTKFVVGLGLVGILLSACGGSEQQQGGYALAVLPTRTPAPTALPGSTPVLEIAPIAVVSLAGPVGEYLARSSEIEPLEQSIEFIHTLSTTNGACFGSTASNAEGYFPFLFGLAAIRWPMDDFTLWQAAAADFPETELVNAMLDTLGELSRRLPLDQPVRACLVPVPPLELPDNVQEQAPRLRRRWHTAALNAVNALPLDNGTLLVTCSAGAECLDTLPETLARGYAMLYQRRMAGLDTDDMTLLDWLVHEARATVFARLLYPEAVFPWPDKFVPEAEEGAWSMVRLYMDRRVNEISSLFYLVYGSPVEEAYPAWAGLIIGQQLVNSYQAAHPDLAWEELAAVSPLEIYEQSGYDPDAVAQR